MSFLETRKLPQYTNYLGFLAKDTTLRSSELNLSSLTLKEPISKDIMGQYEATLTYCCYHSRLIYENKPSNIVKAYNFLNFSPLIFNKALSYIRLSKSENLRALLTNKSSNQSSNSTLSGYLMYDRQHDLPFSITLFDYTVTQSKIFPNEKIIVIAFRGSLSFQNVMKDLKAYTESLFKVFPEGLFADVKQTIDTNPELRKSAIDPLGKINPFGAHSGIVNALKNNYAKIINSLEFLLRNNQDVSKILITGHSLGAGYANVIALGLAQLKKIGQLKPSIHCVTFGGMKTFSRYARNVFNDLLKNNYLTLDRVVTSTRFTDPTFLTTNVIPFVPPNIFHPGYSTLPTEIKTQSRTGRSRHISEIRSQDADIKRKQAWYSISKASSSNYNPLPYYAEYFNKFNDNVIDTSFKSEEYKALINSVVSGKVTLRKPPADKVFKIIENLFNISKTESDSLTNKAAAIDVQVASEIKATPVPNTQAPANVTQEAKETIAAETRAYGPAGLPVGGANPILDTYQKDTVNMQPNEVVYTCYQLTSFVPPPFSIATCHLSYMGVTWLSAGFNFGSGHSLDPLKKSSRDYNSFAYLNFNKKTGLWSYTSDRTGGTRSIRRKRRSSNKTRRIRF
jgi:hypothetical protein